jgi:hypothetical protein
MDDVLALLGDHTPCLLLEQLFLERVPEDIRIQLVDAKIEDPRQLAKRADALWTSRDMQTFLDNACSVDPPLLDRSKVSATRLPLTLTDFAITTEPLVRQLANVDTHAIGQATRVFRIGYDCQP